MGSAGDQGTAEATALALMTLQPTDEPEAGEAPTPVLVQRLTATAHACRTISAAIDRALAGCPFACGTGPWTSGLSGGPDLLPRRLRRGRDRTAASRAWPAISYILLVEWDGRGRVVVAEHPALRQRHHRPPVPHYADQAPLFAAGQLKPVWMDETEIRAPPRARVSARGLAWTISAGRSARRDHQDLRDLLRAVLPAAGGTCGTG